MADGPVWKRSSVITTYAGTGTGIMGSRCPRMTSIRTGRPRPRMRTCGHESGVGQQHGLIVPFAALSPSQVESSRVVYDEIPVARR